MPAIPRHEVLEDKLTRPSRARLERQWLKASQRLENDLDGAITSARTLLESVCKHVLEATGAAYERDWDLPKLHNEASKRLGVTAASQVGPLHRQFFSATHTVVKAVGELRNAAGDAHGKGHEALRASRAEAELAVNMSGAITSFLLSALDSHLAATRRLTAAGEAVLKFDKTTVWRLVDHAAHAPDRYKSLRQRKPKPSLWLVGDTGIYLISNGKPALLIDGALERPEGEPDPLRLAAHAEGCDWMDEVDTWWPIHAAIEGGDDFCIPIELQHFRRALNSCRDHIVIVVSREAYAVYSDLDHAEFEGLAAPA